MNRARSRCNGEDVICLQSNFFFCHCLIFSASTPSRWTPEELFEADMEAFSEYVLGRRWNSSRNGAVLSSPFSLSNFFVHREPDALVKIGFLHSASSSFSISLCSSIKLAPTRACSIVILFRLCAGSFGKGSTNSYWNPFERALCAVIEGVSGHSVERISFNCLGAFWNCLSFRSAVQLT